MSDPLRPTPWRTLAITAVLGGGAMWLALTTIRSFDLDPPVVAWPTIVLLGVAALAGLGLAWVTWQRNHVVRRPADPTASVLTLAMGKAMILGGTALCAAYLAFSLFFLPRLDAAAPRDRVLRGAIAALVCAVLAIAGRLLERSCQVPDPPDDDEADQTADAS